MDKFTLKTDAELDIMAEGGKKLGYIKKRLKEAVKIGGNAKEIEDLAMKLIAEVGGEASFAKVPGYSWATCINRNAGIVHGIPTKNVVFEKGDVVSIDVGLWYKGFHTDTSVTIELESDESTKRFVKAGKKALDAAIMAAKAGRRISDISEAIEKNILAAGYQPVLALVGHGIGKNLHENPQIPCFVSGKKENSPKIVPGMALAIEVMYTLGSPEIEIAKDGWTITTHDGKISGLFEETVAVTTHGSFILTGENNG